MNTGIIKKLDQEIIKLISAGEVIEAPSSVVKELVENAIDSGADTIVVEIKNGGKSYIRISDNGSGIPEKYVETAFEKHATSKIESFEDFVNIHTNGFRGEALSSIAAVSKVAMTTKVKEQNHGIHLVIENDKILEKTRVGARDGTTVIVENLLENIPARKKFLKSDRAETARISDFLIRFALANPKIKIKYINNSKQIFQTYGTGKLKDIIAMIFSENHEDAMIEIEEEVCAYMRIKGVIGNNSAMFSSRKMQYIFVNGRIIKDKSITAHIENAYKKFIPSGNFPMFFLDIVIDPKRIDVNIHPNKMEVKFTQEKEVYSFIESKIASLLEKETMIPNIRLSQEDEKEEDIFSQVISRYKEKKQTESNPLQEKIQVAKQYNKEDVLFVGKKEYLSKEDAEAYICDMEEETVLKEDMPSEILVEPTREKPVFLIPKNLFQEEFPPSKDDKIKCVDLTLLKYAGRVFDTYILLYDDADMYMIDQHAAHERVLYEKYLKDFYSGNIEVQGLLLPNKIGLPVQLVDQAQNIMKDLESFGFECDLFGDNLLLVRGIPTYFDEYGGKKFIDSVFDVYLNENLESDVIQDKIATKACKAAIKGNDVRVQALEVERLLYDLEHCDNKYSCPHGRPTIVRISKYELEKFFKRIL